MALEPGDTWKGLDTLAVEDVATNECLLSGIIVVDMDIDPESNLITIYVSSDISYG